MEKIIGLVDCNSFYASCERVFRPNLNNIPIVVLSNNDGCVVARSKEAKKVGVPMGAPAFKYRDMFEINNVQVFSSNYSLYGDLSRRVFETLSEFSPNVEIYSIDEAFVDLTNMHAQDLTELGKKIKATIFKWTGIPVSVGIAKTKVLAKIANELGKKFEELNGVVDLTNISEEKLDEYLEMIEVEDVWGVGRKYARFLRGMGIDNARKLKHIDARIAKKKMTVQGDRMIRELNNISCIELKSLSDAKQCIASTRSFKYDIYNYDEVSQAVAKYTARAGEKLRHDHSVANYVQVFILTNRFKTDKPQYCNNASMKLPYPTSNTSVLTKYALHCLKHIYKEGYPYKKAGVFLVGIQPDTMIQYDMLFPEKENVRNEELKMMNCIDRINNTWGQSTVRLVAEGLDQKWYMRQDQKSQRYTTCWMELPLVHG